MKVLITGGNGDIAQSIVHLLTETGHEVVSPSHYEMDVCDEQSVERQMTLFGADAIVNCAGYIVPQKISECDIETFRKHFEVNIIGATTCCKYAILNGCKDVINIGSTSSFEGKAEWGAYCASKSAIASLTETLAREGVYSVSINPARTKTKMRKSLFPDEDESTLITPNRIASFVLCALRHEYKSGSHVIVLKDGHYILPIRSCPK